MGSITLVSHRLFQEGAANQIIVLNEGKIVESGSHENLLVRIVGVLPLEIDNGAESEFGRFAMVAGGGWDGNG
jgi:hypothetical protein